MQPPQLLDGESSFWADDHSARIWKIVDIGWYRDATILTMNHSSSEGCCMTGWRSPNLHRASWNGFCQCICSASSWNDVSERRNTWWWRWVRSRRSMIANGSENDQQVSGKCTLMAREAVWSRIVLVLVVWWNGGSGRRLALHVESLPTALFNTTGGLDFGDCACSISRTFKSSSSTERLKKGSMGIPKI